MGHSNLFLSLFTELAEFEDHFSFKIVFHGPGNRSYILAADSHDVMEQWMKALACASHDYMKLMVADLQRQLEELEGMLSNEHCNISSVTGTLTPTHDKEPFSILGTEKK